MGPEIEPQPHHDRRSALWIEGNLQTRLGFRNIPDAVLWMVHCYFVCASVPHGVSRLVVTVMSAGAFERPPLGGFTMCEAVSAIEGGQDQMCCWTGSVHHLLLSHCGTSRMAHCRLAAVPMQVTPLVNQCIGVVLNEVIFCCWTHATLFR